MADKRSSKGTTGRQRRQPARPVLTVHDPNTVEEWAVALAVLFVEHQRTQRAAGMPPEPIASDQRLGEITD